MLIAQSDLVIFRASFTTCTLYIVCILYKACIYEHKGESSMLIAQSDLVIFTASFTTCICIVHIRPEMVRLLS